MEEHVEDCLCGSVGFGCEQHSLEANESSSRRSLQSGKLLQESRRLRLNRLQVVAVVDANDVPEILRCPTSAEPFDPRLFWPGLTFAAASDSDDSDNAPPVFARTYR